MFVIENMLISLKAYHQIVKGLKTILQFNLYELFSKAQAINKT